MGREEEPHKFLEPNSTLFFLLFQLASHLRVGPFNPDIKDAAGKKEV